MTQMLSFLTIPDHLVAMSIYTRVNPETLADTSKNALIDPQKYAPKMCIGQSKFLMTISIYSTYHHEHITGWTAP